MDALLEEEDVSATEESSSAVDKERPHVEAALGLTEKWDAREAGREVAETALQQLSGKPDFFLLFSTIHYENHGGFEEFLNGVWEVLPEGTPLVGGTVAGFMNNHGVFVQGATALAVSYPHMDVAIGYGRNTKRNPKKAAKQCAEMIKKELVNSPYKNNFLLNFVSSAELMKIPGQGYKKVIDSGFMSKFVTLVFGLSQYLIQKGPGREDEIFEELIHYFPSHNMILGTSVDDYKGRNNYIFNNNFLLKNSLSSLGLQTNLDVTVKSTHGMNKTNVEFNITKISKDGHIIKEINNKPAVPELLRILEWPEDFLNEKTMFFRMLYYPISVKRGNRQIPVVMPFILKDSIVTPCVVEKGKVSILTVSGINLLDALQKNIEYFDGTIPEFGFFSTCGTILQTLGNKINLIRMKLLEYFKDKPFIMVFCAGEGTYSPTQGINYANMSYNTVIFRQNKK